MTQEIPLTASTSSSSYDPGVIEPRWQRKWRREHLFETPAPRDGLNCYVATCPPFTTGDAHIGHVRNLTMSDAYARFRRAQGDRVLFSIGYDAFGLPNEIASVQHQQSPRLWVETCRQRMTSQFDRLGYSFDWGRTYLSCDPAIYHWTQWLFLTMFEQGLVFKQEGLVNWCDGCKTVLANLQAEEGRCWRCHGDVRMVWKEQWYLRLSAYAAELHHRLSELEGWNRPALESQRRLLGRAEGVELDAELSSGRRLVIFTQHPRSVDGAAFVAISDDHPEAQELLREHASQEGRPGTTDERTAAMRDPARAPVVPTGVRARICGLERVLPVLVSSLTSQSYSREAVLGIPAVEKADLIVAQRFGIPVGPAGLSGPAIAARPAVRYRLRDIPISRQRFWGTPIPVINCESCGAVPVPRGDLPVLLSGTASPHGTGSQPHDDRTLRECQCPRCLRPSTRETETLDCQMDGLWFLVPACVPAQERSSDPFASAALPHWFPAAQLFCGTDVGGYMLNARFLNLALRDALPACRHFDREPIRQLTMHEMVLLDGRKMSKHLGNVVSPEDLIGKYGADSLRFAMLLAAAPERSIRWTEGKVLEANGFLSSVWSFFDRQRFTAVEGDDPATPEPGSLTARLQLYRERAVTRVTEDFQRRDFHRAAQNVLLLFRRIREVERRFADAETVDPASRRVLAWASITLLQLMAPLTPHIAEELWLRCGGKGSISCLRWPSPTNRPVAEMIQSGAI